MLTTLLGAVLGALGKAAVVQVAEYLQREADKQDVRAGERQRLELEALARENAALQWLLSVADDPRAGDLRVQHGTTYGTPAAITLVHPADADRGPAGTGV